MSDSFPFPAIVGLELAKTSLVLHAVDPRLGGVLLSGHRGCAKTTIARAFADLLPSGALCEVPLGASEDRLLGSVDVAGVLERREWRHQPGLLEQADGGVLFVDEVNLLPDELSDQLLDAAATGGYQLEREGMSHRVDSRFVLIGTMNPEEGQLRPQLADRFAHQVAITTESPAIERALVIERRLEFETDAVAFRERWADETEQLRERIAAARERLSRVVLPVSSREAIANKSEQLELEGMRCALAVAKTALAVAAWDGRNQVGDGDVELAWQLCLDPNGKPETNGIRNPPPPAAPDGQSPSPQGTHDDRPPSRSFVSLQPSDAADDAIVQMAEDGDAPAWPGPARSAFAFSSLCRRSSASSARPGTVHWRETVLGWIKDGGARRLRRWQSRRIRQVWVFVDASRSAGANGFLARALTLMRRVLDPRIAAAMRVHVLELSEGRLHWMGKGMVASEARRSFEQPIKAAGISLLSEALTELYRDGRRRGIGNGDLVLICSDGIATTSEGRSAKTIRDEMRRSLLRLSRTGSELRWIAPRPRRGFTHPVESLGLWSICLSEAI